MLPKKKRCCVCRKLFRPDPRVGDRQRACSAKDCQRRRRLQTQASWRARNPSHQASYRLQKRALDAEAAQEAGKPAVTPPSPRRLPSDLATFPWDRAEPALGFAGADLLSLLVVQLVRLVNELKDQRPVEKPLPMQAYAPTGRDPCRDQ